jgi:hypothetical protein
MDSRLIFFFLFLKARQGPFFVSKTESISRCVVFFPGASPIIYVRQRGLRPQTPAGKGRKAPPRPIPTDFLPFTNGKNNDLKSLQKPAR